MSETIYKKVGDEFAPIGLYDREFVDYLPYGSHLVVVETGRSTRYNIDPDYAPSLAVAINCREDLCNAIFEASKARPTNEEKFTPSQLKAWKVMEKELGNSMMYLTYPSVHDIAERTIMSLQDKMNEIMECEAVREAYDHFMLMAKLCLKENSSK